MTHRQQEERDALRERLRERGRDSERESGETALRRT